MRRREAAGDIRGGGSFDHVEEEGSLKYVVRPLKVKDLTDARRCLERLKATEQGSRIMAPKMVHRVFRVENLNTRAAHILKQNMLSVGGEVSLPREVFDFGKKEVPAVISGTLSHFQKLIPKLKMQPFGLKDLAAELERRLREEGPRVLRLGGREYDLGERTLIMGIVNVTPDSFSDGGKYLERNAAVEHAMRLVEEGADILDIGGESTRPGSDFVSLEEELSRVLPVVEELAGRTDVPLSIDTTKSEVARRALDAGCAMVNEVSAGRLDGKMLPLVASRGVPVCLMHMQGLPKTMQEKPFYKDVIGEIYAFLAERAEAAVKAGVDPSNIIVDPGIGFGKTLEHNLEILQKLKEFKALGFPLLLGTSRKSFIGMILDLPAGERLEGTAASVALGIAGGADIVRVHDVKEMKRVAAVADAVVGKGRK